MIISIIIAIRWWGVGERKRLLELKKLKSLHYSVSSSLLRLYSICVDAYLYTSIKYYYCGTAVFTCLLLYTLLLTRPVHVMYT